MEYRRRCSLRRSGSFPYDTPLTVEHEIQALREAGFSSVEILHRWGATVTLRAIKETQRQVRDIRQIAYKAADNNANRGINMAKVKLTITESRCRGRTCRAGDVFIVEDLCPPLCHELWSSIYPQVYALLNGGTLDHGDSRAKEFDARCPDGGRVSIHGEVLDTEDRT